jgi:hypothetical protein
MFTVDEAAAAAIRQAWHEGGELAGAVEFKRHFRLITDNARAAMCARIIAGWTPPPEQSAPVPKRAGRSRRRPGAAT